MKKILLLTLLPVAAMATSIKGIGNYQDWDLVCDNTGTCRMAGYQDESSDPVSILFTPAAGENAAVAQAIREHYLPDSADGALPESKVGAILALADKLDTLLSFFSVGLIPSGSNDPYALRRATQGIVRILEDFGWNIPMDELIASLYALSFDSLTYDNQEEVLNFIKARVDKMMGSTAKDIKEAVLASSNFVVSDMIEAAEALTEAAKSEDYKSSVESLSRAFNLAEKAEGSVKIDASLFENEQEKELAQAVESLELKGSAIDKLEQLFALSPVIDAFFDNTMVMAEDVDVKNNRLAILAELVNKAKTVAAFNLLNTK